MDTWTKRVLIAAAGVVTAWGLLMALLWVGQRHLIYLPDRHLADPPADVSVIPVTTDDGIDHRLWVVPAEGEASARVIVFNGNAGNKADRLPLARNLAAEGLEVVLFDYRGYGEVAGSPTEAGLSRDGWAAATATHPTELPLVYFGESIGAAVAAGLGLELPPDALVLRSPFTSLPDMARLHYPFVPSGLVRDRFDVEGAIGSVDAPVLVVVGTADSIVPPRLSRRVYEAARSPKELVEMAGQGHNDPALTYGEELASAVGRWVRAVTG